MAFKLQAAEKKTVNGFTLVELAIVVLCIGILAATFLLGSNLIEASKVSKEIASLMNYKVQHNQFAEKYTCLPGDCPRATDFLPTTCASRITGGFGCNGDGNGRYDVWLTSRSDPHRYWIHLELAEFVKPVSFTRNNSAFSPSTFSSISTHFVEFGEAINYLNGTIPSYNVVVFSNAVSDTQAYAAVVTPTRAFDIDKKLDDGKPLEGVIRGHKGDTYVTPSVPATGECNNGNAYAVLNTLISCFVSYKLDD